MNQFKIVSSSREISKSLADLVEDMYPAHCQPCDRAQLVRQINDILQGRSDRMPMDLLRELEAKLVPDDRTRFAEIREQVEDFLLQKEVMYQTYTNRGAQSPVLGREEIGGRMLKIVRQEHYDALARVVFSENFFRDAYFDHVTFYCLPDGADFTGSILQDCTFAVCGVRGATFERAKLYGTEFHSSLLCSINFTDAVLANCHFYDSYMAVLMLKSGIMKSCTVLDSTMLGICFTKAWLDGCRFDRVMAENIRDLHTATITMGGATAEECRANRTAIFRAFGIADHGGGQSDGL